MMLNLRKVLELAVVAANTNINKDKGFTKWQELCAILLELDIHRHTETCIYSEDHKAFFSEIGVAINYRDDEHGVYLYEYKK